MDTAGNGLDHGLNFVPGPQGVVDSLPVRVAVALGDPELERTLLSSLSESGAFAIAERCLSADQLLASLGTDQVDVALVASGLHRLSASMLEELGRLGAPLVVLSAALDEESGLHTPGIVLPLDAEPETVRQALLAAVRGEHPRAVAPKVTAQKPPAESDGVGRAKSSVLCTLAVVSGHGSPGRTTVALALAAALGAVAPTVLVDADLSGPSVAAHLDADPTRNLYMLAHGEPETPRDWARAIEQEVQPLSRRSPLGFVLCGVPKPEMRAGISVRFFETLVAELEQRYSYVILDVGADLLGQEAAVHRAALRLARQVLLVSGADLVSLWHVRTALGLLKGSLQVGADRIALVINRHDRRHHHGRDEIEWALGLPTAAVVPHDYRAAQRALASQHPLVMESGRAAHALMDLAERVHRGKITLSADQTVNGGGIPRWLPRFPAPLPLRKTRVNSDVRGVSHGEHFAPQR